MTHDLHSFHFYGILDTLYVSTDKWEDKCKALLDGGADMIEFRAKAETDEQCIELLDAIVPLCDNQRVPLIVNDSLELAVRYPNTGLHLGQDDMDIATAREILGPDRILGLSTHSTEQAQNALNRGDLLSYFAVGPIYANNTKPDYTPVGTELIEAVDALEPELPFFCIGGVNRKTMQAVKDAGAQRVCVVSDALLAEDTASVVREIRSFFAG